LGRDHKRKGTSFAHTTITLTNIANNIPSIAHLAKDIFQGQKLPLVAETKKTYLYGAQPLSQMQAPSIYTPHTNKEYTSYLKNLNIPVQATNNTTLIRGDWNAMWKKGKKTTDKKEWPPSSATRELKSFAYKHGLINTTKKEKIDLSFRARNSCMRAALDRWLINDTACKWSTSIEIIPFPWSDHDTVVLFLVKNSAKKEGMWKLNISILCTHKTVVALKKG
jgi:hypothetical protein